MTKRKPKRKLKFPKCLLKFQKIYNLIGPATCLANSYAKIEEADVSVDEIHGKESTINECLKTDPHFLEAWDEILADDCLKNKRKACCGHLWGAKIFRNQRIPRGYIEVRGGKSYKIKPQRCFVDWKNIKVKFKFKKTK